MDVQFVLRSDGSEQNAQRFERAAQRVQRSAASAAGAVEQMRRQMEQLNQVRGLGQLNQQINQSTQAQRQSAQATQVTSRSQRQQAAEVARARRAWLTFNSTLGGSARAYAQLERANDRINQALRANIITTRQAELARRQANATFTTANINAKDLRLNMQSLNQRMIALGNTASILAVGPLSGVGARVSALNSLVSQTSIRFAAVGAGAVGLGLAFAKLGAATFRAGEAMQGFQARLGLVADSEQEVARLTDDLFEAAQRSRAGFQSLGDLFVRSAQGAKEFGIANERLVGVTETVAKALALTRTEGAAAQAVITQFSQALASGELRGDELRTLRENAVGLLQAISEGLGVTIGELLEMAEQGELTTERVITALERARTSVDQQFGELPVTVGQALTKIGNTFTILLADFDKAIGLSRGLADNMNALAESFDDARPAISRFGRALSGSLQVSDEITGLEADVARLLILLEDFATFGPQLLTGDIDRQVEAFEELRRKLREIGEPLERFRIETVETGQEITGVMVPGLGELTTETAEAANAVGLLSDEFDDSARSAKDAAAEVKSLFDQLDKFDRMIIEAGGGRDPFAPPASVRNQAQRAAEQQAQAIEKVREGLEKLEFQAAISGFGELERSILTTTRRFEEEARAAGLSAQEIAEGKERIVEALRRQAAAQRDATAATREENREFEQLIREQEQQIAERQRALEEPFRRAGENIQRGLGDTFTQIFEDGKFKFETLADSIKSIFARLAGELVSLFVVDTFRRIVAGGQGVFGGGFGGAGAGGSQGIGQLLGGLVGLGGGGGQVARLQGMGFSQQQIARLTQSGGALGGASGGLSLGGVTGIGTLGLLTLAAVGGGLGGGVPSGILQGSAGLLGAAGGLGVLGIGGGALVPLLAGGGISLAAGGLGGLAGAFAANKLGLQGTPEGAAVGGSIGGIAGGLAGFGGAIAAGSALSGAAAGAVAGSVVPVLGTVIGLVLGALVGALGGGLFKPDTRTTQIINSTADLFSRAGFPNDIARLDQAAGFPASLPQLEAFRAAGFLTDEQVADFRPDLLAQRRASAGKIAAARLGVPRTDELTLAAARGEIPGVLQGITPGTLGLGAVLSPGGDQPGLDAVNIAAVLTNRFEALGLSAAETRRQLRRIAEEADVTVASGLDQLDKGLIANQLNMEQLLSAGTDFLDFITDLPPSVDTAALILEHLRETEAGLRLETGALIEQVERLESIFTNLRSAVGSGLGRALEGLLTGQRGFAATFREAIRDAIVAGVVEGLLTSAAIKGALDALSEDLFEVVQRIINGEDVSGEEIAGIANAFMNELRPVFEVAEAIAIAFNEALGLTADSVAEVNDELERTRNLTRSVEEFIREQTAGPSAVVAPETRLANAQAAFQADREAFLAGEIGIAPLLQSGGNLIDAGQAFFASGPGAALIRDQVFAALRSLPGVDVTGFLPGLQSGGSFTVPGSGGADSRLVSFRATPGERVSVATASDQRESTETLREVGREIARGNSAADSRLERIEGLMGALISENRELRRRMDLLTARPRGTA